MIAVYIHYLKGEHATYSVYLDDAQSEQTYAKPFLVIPDKGYKEAAFTITVADTALLDFEVPAWQKFAITVRHVCALALKKRVTNNEYLRLLPRRHLTALILVA